MPGIAVCAPSSNGRTPIEEYCRDTISSVLVPVPLPEFPGPSTGRRVLVIAEVIGHLLSQPGLEDRLGQRPQQPVRTGQRGITSPGRAHQLARSPAPRPTAPQPTPPSRRLHQPSWPPALATAPEPASPPRSPTPQRPLSPCPASCRPSVALPANRSRRVSHLHPSSDSPVGTAVTGVESQTLSGISELNSLVARRPSRLSGPVCRASVS